MSHSTCRKSLTAIAKGDGIIEFGSRFFAKSQGPAAESLCIFPESNGLLAITSIYAGYGIMAKGKGSFSFCLSTFPKGRRSSAGSFIDEGNVSFLLIVIVFATKSHRIITVSLGILADDRGALAFRLGAIADGYGIFDRCRGIDSRSQGVTPGGTGIVVVAIVGRVDRFYTIIMDTGSCTATTFVNAVYSCLQLGHIDRIGQIRTSRHAGDLTGNHPMTVMPFAFSIAIRIGIADGQRIGRSFPNRIPVFISECCARLLVRRALRSAQIPQAAGPGAAVRVFAQDDTRRNVCLLVNIIPCSIIICHSTITNDNNPLSRTIGFRIITD
ncbi:unknown [Megasphaera elsdenii CAG:570]|uniref:Uncharacterized protein n=1 Tax=Megasphaera elsdenii CAG:570 TaxID=1263087 RepID=R7MU08_MEGEL|nr:unknown [Megasphaera elsdenii CAG:570]